MAIVYANDHFTLAVFDRARGENFLFDPLKTSPQKLDDPVEVLLLSDHELRRFFALPQVAIIAFFFLLYFIQFILSFEAKNTHPSSPGDPKTMESIVGCTWLFLDCAI